MGSRRYVLLLLLPIAACGVRLESSPTDATTRGLVDADTSSIDAALDAPPRACTGGDASATDATGACFIFTRAVTTWGDANIACAAMMAHLAIITSPATNATITTLVGTVDVFIGGTDALVEGTWKWTDGTAIALAPLGTYENWRTGEPNNGNGTHEEDCLVLEGSKTPPGTWDDRPCATESTTTTPGKYGYVCQY